MGILGTALFIVGVLVGIVATVISLFVYVVKNYR